MEQGITKTMSSSVLETHVPFVHHNLEVRWIGPNRGPREAFAADERMAEKMLICESQTEPKWRVHSSTHLGRRAGKVAVLAALLCGHGKEKTRSRLESPMRLRVGNDCRQARVIHAYECDQTVGNSRHSGIVPTNLKMLRDKGNRLVGILFPILEKGRTRANIFDMAMARHGPNAENSGKFMKFPSSGKPQLLHTRTNSGYPVRRCDFRSGCSLSGGTVEADDLFSEKTATNRRQFA